MTLKRSTAIVNGSLSLNLRLVCRFKVSAQFNDADDMMQNNNKHR